MTVFSPFLEWEDYILASTTLNLVIMLFFENRREKNQAAHIPFLKPITTGNKRFKKPDFSLSSPVITKKPNLSKLKPSPNTVLLFLYSGWIAFFDYQMKVANAFFSQLLFHASTFCLGFLFGIMWGLLKVILRSLQLYRELTLRPHQYINSETAPRRQLTKGLLTTHDIIFTLLSIIGYCLGASWVSPVFLVACAVAVVRSTYSLAKNIYQLQQLPAISHEKDNNENSLTLYQQTLHYHRGKIIRSLVDLTFSVIILGLCVLWFSMPIPAGIGLVAAAFAWKFIRDFLTQKTQGIKQLTIKTQQEKLATPIKTVEGDLLPKLTTHKTKTNSCTCGSFFCQPEQRHSLIPEQDLLIGDDYFLTNKNKIVCI
ncbi:MAG: hypothetical protein Tsb005_03890 [Gammaproteobacteria bacterium]